MSDDTRRVLDLLAQGKITVDEADRLLKAVTAAAPSAEAASGPGAVPRPRWLRINIQKQSEDRHGETKNVNVRVPISFVKGGMRLGALIAPFAGEKAIARLRERGYDLDLSRLDAEAIETWLKDVDDLNVHIDNGKEQVRITCE
jgi:SHOCT-like domain